MNQTDVILYDEVEVEYRTNLEGWTGKNNLYYGKDDNAKERAKYANCTHKKCPKCQGIFKKDSYCRPCVLKTQTNNFLKLEEVEYDGISMLSIYNDDTFFHDLESAYEYAEDHDINIKDLQLVLCEKKFIFQHVNIDEINEEYHTEEESLSDFHPDIKQKVKELNDLLDKTESKLYFQTNKRIKL